MAKTILDMIPGMNGDDYISRFKNAADSTDRLNTAFGAGLTGLTGTLSMLGNLVNWANDEDMTQYDNRISQIGNMRDLNYYDTNSLVSAYENQPQKTAVNLEDINPTAGQSTAQIGNSTLSGAMTGLQIGGPYGAIIGGVIGLGSGIWSDAAKRKTNEINVNLRNRIQDFEYKKNQYALNSGLDRAQEYQFGRLYGSKKSTGGLLKKYESKPAEYKIFHNRCKGGTLVRIKTK